MTTAELKATCRTKGFDLVGIAPAVPPPHYAEYLRWLRDEMHGEMSYMSRHAPLRASLENLLPGAKSVIVVGLNYARPKNPHPNPPPYSLRSQEGGDRPIPSQSHCEGARGRIAKYAWGRDYHAVIRKRLKRVGRWLEERESGALWRVCVDSAPVLERDYAMLAGIGWFGKNTMIINSHRGSYFLIGCLLTTLELEPDAPAVGGCGTCRACIDACPTGAIVVKNNNDVSGFTDSNTPSNTNSKDPDTHTYAIDARRCISYLTIEKRGEIDPDLQPLMGDWVFGCDVCQDVCPFNHPRENAPSRAAPTQDTDMAPRLDPNPSLSDLVLLSPEEFTQRYAGTAVMRAKRDGMTRNAEIAAKNHDTPLP